MNKFLIILLIMLDGFMLSSYDRIETTPNSELSRVDIECFELNALNINTVDSTINYYKNGAITHQWIYYSDGREGIFYSDFYIKDLTIRRAYIQFKNAHDYVVYNYYREQAKEIVKQFPSRDLENQTEYLYFNSYLKTLGILPIKSYGLFIKDIKNNNYYEFKKGESFSKFIVLFSVGMILLLTFSVVYYTDVKRITRKVVNTS